MNSFSLALAVIAVAILVVCAANDEHEGPVDKVKEKVEEVKDMLTGDDKKPEGAVPPQGDKAAPAGEEKKDEKKEEIKDEKKEEKKDEKKEEEKKE